MFEFEKFIEELKTGFVFEFEYMNKQHKISSFDTETYTVIVYTKDNYSTREERKIVKEDVLKEMFNDMENITYVY